MNKMLYKICLIYRPITVLLLQLMHYPKFRETSKYYKKMYNTDGTFADTLDGNIAVNALAEMEENFARNIPEAEVEDTINSPHLFSEFYDGAQLFDTRLSNFHALIISLLNLPPTYRTKKGCGAFVIAVHTLRESSRAERTLTLRLFVEELHLLRCGFKVTIDGTKYFIQARCISHL